MNDAHSTTTGAADATTNANTPASLLINSKRACLLLAIGERRLWVLTRCKAIPSRKIGASVRYSPAELTAWVACGCPTEPGSADRVRKAVRE